MQTSYLAFGILSSGKYVTRHRLHGSPWWCRCSPSKSLFRRPARPTKRPPFRPWVKATDREIDAQIFRAVRADRGQDKDGTNALVWPLSPLRSGLASQLVDSAVVYCTEPIVDDCGCRLKNIRGNRECDLTGPVATIGHVGSIYPRIQSR